MATTSTLKLHKLILLSATVVLNTRPMMMLARKMSVLSRLLKPDLENSIMAMVNNSICTKKENILRCFNTSFW